MNTWNIYEKKGYKSVLSMLDTRFESFINAAKIQVNCGEDPIFAGQNVRQKMEDFMDSIEGYGASDTEPRVALVTFICNELNLPFDQETIDKLHGVINSIDHSQPIPSI